jgi:hypothetical protein
MEMLDVHGRLVDVHTNEGRYPLKPKGKSKLQTQVQHKLVKKWPLYTVLEEFKVPGSRLTVDFFIPVLKLVVEVQGKQHKEHTDFFHGDRLFSKKFVKQKQNDMIKAQWAASNGFSLVEIWKLEDIENV